MNKQANSPGGLKNSSDLELEQRIITAFDNPNIGSAALIELIEQVAETADQAGQTIAAERDKLLDVTQCRDPSEARERIAALETNRDRLRAAGPRLRERLGQALHSEATERWLADFRRVEQQRNEAVAAFQRYPELAQEIVEMFMLAETVDKEVSRVNGSAPDGVHHRLRGVELTARDQQQFTVGTPSLAATVELREWDNSGKKLWPLHSANSFAVAFAESMIVPSGGSRWADPDVRQQRRAEIEKGQRELGEYYQRETVAQEERINAEARERAAAMRRAG
jgi:hypothetical protein